VSTLVQQRDFSASGAFSLYDLSGMNIAEFVLP
jgi:hypothetical protein